MQKNKVVPTSPHLVMSVDGFELFSRWKQMQAHIAEVSRQLELKGFKERWLSKDRLEEDVRNWQEDGYEVKRLIPEEEALASNLATPWELKRRGVQPRVPIFVRKKPYP